MPETPNSEEKRQLIDGIYQGRTQEGLNTATAAQSISSFSNDALSGEKYLAELLQNADDAQSPNVFWTLTSEGYLILMHEGKAFTNQDVSAICDHASSQRKKVSDIEQIGNKGVGFKAVFTVAETVYIFSDGYHFRFDENHAKWQGRVEAFPWQIIPIWTDPSELPSGIDLDLKKTCFVFKLRPEIRQGVGAHLTKLTSRHLLFLRHVKQMNIVLPDKSVAKPALAPPVPVVDNIVKINCTPESDWLYYSSKIKLPADLREKLKAGINIPTKYKSVTEMPLQIAILAKGTQLVPVENGQKVFCYLPTDLDLGMKVLVNAEFLLEPSRMHLREGVGADAWNEWMLTSLWKMLLEFLSLLVCKTNYGYSIFQILTNPKEISWGNLERFKPACVDVFQRALEENYLVRTLPTKIVRVKSAMLDWTDFIRLFGTSEQKETCAHPDMQNQALIRELGATVFWIDDLIKSAQTRGFMETIRDPQRNRQFLECLKTLEERMKQEALTNKIKVLLANTPLILSSRNELKKSTEVFFPEETLRYALASDEFLDLLHANINADDALRNWLVRMNVQTITLPQIVHMANKAPAHSVSFVIHLVKSGAWEKLGEPTKAALKTLRLKRRSKHTDAQGNFQPAKDCYLPKVYQPDISLEAFAGKACEVLLSQEYLAEGVDRNALKKFFQYMGVSEKITLDNLASFLPHIDKVASPDQYIAFTQWVFRHCFLGQEAQAQAQAKTLQALSKLAVFDMRNQRAETKDCYFADIYEPETPLQQHAPAMRFLSEDYISEDRKNITEWRTFFARLGVHQRIVMRPREFLSRGEQDKNVEGASEYFSHLQKTVPNLFPSYTCYSLYQHSVTFYLEIPCATSLCRSPVFWKLLRSNWDLFASALQSGVIYHTAHSKTPVPSNVHVLVEKAIQAKYGGDKKAVDFYPVAIQKSLGQYASDHAFAEVTEGLSLAQAALLGFKARLPLEDCAAILRKIAETNRPEAEFGIILFLYQQILTYVKEERQDFGVLSGTPLLTDAGTFTPPSELHYLENNFLHLTSPNDKIIKKPESLAHEDFEKLCRAFSIQSIRRRDIKIVVSRGVDSSLREVLKEKWFYLLNIILDKKELMLKQDRLSEAPKHLRKFEDRWAALTVQAAESFQCCYATIVNETMDLWINEVDKTIWHTEPLSDIEHEDRRCLYQFLYEHFELTNDIDEERFLSVMCATSTRLSRKYAQQSAVNWITLDAVNTATELQQATTSSLIVLPSNAEAVPAASPMAVQYSRSASPMSVDADTATAGCSSAVTGAPAGAYFSQTAQTRVPNISGSRLFHAPPGSDGRRSFAQVAEGEEPVRSTSKRLAFLGNDFESRQAVGKRGERAVYEHLRKKHQEKYGSEKIHDTSDGYIVQADQYIKTVRWLNKNNESGKPYDFEITVKKGEREKIRRLEVKATRSREQKVEVNYSLGEWQQLQQADENNQYKLYVVRGIDLENDDAEQTLQSFKRAQLLRLEPVQYIRLTLRE